MAVKDDLLGACKPLGNDIGAQVTLRTSLVKWQPRDTGYYCGRHEILLAMRLWSERLPHSAKPRSGTRSQKLFWTKEVSARRVCWQIRPCREPFRAHQFRVLITECNVTSPQHIQCHEHEAEWHENACDRGSHRGRGGRYCLGVI